MKSLLIFMFLCTTVQATEEKLSDCPDKPNCVSTKASRAEQKIEPIPYTKSLSEFKVDVANALDKMGNNKVITSSEDYFSVEFTSSFFRFVDDFEILFDQKKSLIHLKSKSRVGHYDFGANKKRVEEFTKTLSGTTH
jgi:uncharacterized protein (DUF1499 family)